MMQVPDVVTNQRREIQDKTDAILESLHKPQGVLNPTIALRPISFDKYFLPVPLFLPLPALSHSISLSLPRRMGLWMKLWD
jgi:hypothetical protein